MKGGPVGAESVESRSPACSSASIGGLYAFPRIFLCKWTSPRSNVYAVLAFGARSEIPTDRLADRHFIALVTMLSLAVTARKCMQHLFQMAMSTCIEKQYLPATLRRTIDNEWGTLPESETWDGESRSPHVAYPAAGERHLL